MSTKKPTPTGIGAGDTFTTAIIDDIAADLLNGQTITPLGALRNYGCYRLAAAIHVLRRRGLPIKTVPHTFTARNGRKSQFAAYSIPQSEGGRIQP